MSRPKQPPQPSAGKSKGIGREEAQRSSQGRSEPRESNGALSLTLPVPPSTNNCYVNAAKGRRLTPKGRAYKRDVMHLANEAGAQTMKLEAPYSLSLIVYFGSTRRSDVSNRVKLIEDALMQAIDGDDTDIRTIWLEKRISRDNPRAEVALYGANHIVREESE